MTAEADISRELVRLFPPETGPSVVVDQGIYTVRWPDPDWVTLEFDLLTTDRRTGDTSAEAAIYLTSEGDNRFLHRARLNLLSTIAQERLAKYIAGRAPHLKVRWTEVISTSCDYILEEYRKGEPYIKLRDAPEPAHRGSLLPPLLAGDGTTILFGDGGTGKSLMAVAVAASLQSGQTVIGGLEPTHQLHVAYLDWEWEAHVHRRRLREMWPEGDLPDIVYVPCRRPLIEEADRIRRMVRDEAIGFLVLDSVALACGGEPESAEVAINFFNALRVLGLPSLAIAHVTKSDAKGSADKPFGSAYWANTARSTWYVRRSDGSDQQHLSIGLFNKKANDTGLAAPIGLSVQFAEGLILIQRAEVREEPDLDNQRPLRYRINDLLNRQPMLAHELADELEVAVDSVRKTLRRGESAGHFVRSHRPDGIEQWARRVEE